MFLRSLCLHQFLLVHVILGFINICISKISETHVGASEMASRGPMKGVLCRNAVLGNIRTFISTLSFFRYMQYIYYTHIYIYIYINIYMNKLRIM